MVYESVGLVRKDLEEERRLLKLLRRRLEALASCKGIIIKKNKGVRNEFYIQICEGGKRRQIYVNKLRTADMERIKEKRVLALAVQRISRNVNLMEQFVDNYNEISPKAIYSELPEAYANCDAYSRLLYSNTKSEGHANVREWLEMKCRIKFSYDSYMPEGLIHTASDGTLTRSKSEAIIIDILNELGIPFVYECPLVVNGKHFLPDFICLNLRTGEEFLIEHMGRMDQSSYANRQFEKLCDYMEEGFVPNQNLILTFDNMEGNIDAHQIRKVLKALLC